MKILFISNIDSFGGTRTYLMNIINFYRSKQCQITIATETYDNIRDLLSIEKFNNIAVINLGKRPSWIAKTTYYLNLPTIFYEYKVINSLLKKVSPRFLVITPAEVGCFLTAVGVTFPKLLVVHSYPASNIPLFYRLLSISDHKNTIVTVSEYALQQIKKFWHSIIKHMLLTYIYNPLEIKVEKLKNPLRVLTIGHIESFKDPSTWIKTVKEFVSLMPNTKYKFTWLGTGSKLDWLKDQITQLSLSKYCEIIMPVNDVAKYYADTYLYFQPSIFESQGISVGNAQYLGIPVVVSNAGGLKEMVANNKTGKVIPAGEYQMMALAIYKLIKSKKNYAKYSATAFKASSTHTVQGWIRRLESLHKRIGINLGQ